MSIPVIGVQSDNRVYPSEDTGQDDPAGQAPVPADTKSVGKHVFDFRNCRYTVKTKTGSRVLLHDIHGTIKSGEVLAVMGPSGAGKTTLLNLLTFVRAGGEAFGDVTLNGEVMTANMFSRYCAVVTQVDHHWAFLTCRESLEYAADLYLSVPKQEKKRRVDELLNQMGLMTCADTKCGNQFLQGLSGGQKRRLSLALSLIKSPLILFLDEPTSGLDAAAAASIMAFLKDLAARMDIIIFCTIHQPSSKVYEGFDGTMVLSSGKIAYCGPASEVVAYCSSIGRPMPSNVNPAEYLLDLVNSEFSEPAEVEAVLEAWQQRESEHAAVEKRVLPSKTRYGTSFLAQVMHLVRRHFVLVIRDPTLYLGRAFMFMGACAFFAIIYIEARQRVQEQVLYRMFLMMWYIGVPSSLGVIAVYAFNTEFFAIRREIKDGMYSPLAYLISNLLLQLPLMIVLSCFALGVGPYAITAFHGPNFLQMMLLFAAALWSFECMAQLFSVVFSNPLLGMLLYLCMWFSSFLFAGVMVPEEDVIWPFRAFSYLLPLRWTLSSMATIEYKDTTYDGVLYTTAGVPTCRNPLVCYGTTGEEVLASLGDSYQSLGPEDNVARDIGFILAIAGAFKLGFCVLMWKKTTSMQVPRKGTEAPKATAGDRVLTIQNQASMAHVK